MADWEERETGPGFGSPVGIGYTVLDWPARSTSAYLFPAGARIAGNRGRNQLFVPFELDIEDNLLPSCPCNWNGVPFCFPVRTFRPMNRHQGVYWTRFAFHSLNFGQLPIYV